MPLSVRKLSTGGPGQWQGIILFLKTDITHLKDKKVKKRSMISERQTVIALLKIIFPGFCRRTMRALHDRRCYEKLLLAILHLRNATRLCQW
jgi:hypothetical protein